MIGSLKQIKTTITASEESQTVRRRRPHRKSRGGCIPCKRRRVKCDERKPLCTNCLVRGDDCLSAEPAAQVTVSTGGTEASTLLPPNIIKILPQHPADPFKSLPIDMIAKSADIFHHFMVFRSQLRSPMSKGLEEDFPELFRASLILAGNHHRLCTEIPAFQHTCLTHRSIVIKKVASEVTESNIVEQSVEYWINHTPRRDLIHLPFWVTRSVNTLLLADACDGDDISTAAHVRGLFSMLEARRQHASTVESQRLQQGINYGCDIQQRGVFVNLSLISAARRFDLQSDHAVGITTKGILGYDCRAWANAGYLYTHMLAEFVSNVPPEHTLRILSRSEAPVMKWLKTKLRVKILRDQRDVWEATTAVTAYYITMKSLCPLFRSTGGEEAGDDAGLGKWFENLMGTWLAKPYPSVTWDLAEIVIKMIDAWRETVIRRILV